MQLYITISLGLIVTKQQCNRDGMLKVSPLIQAALNCPDCPKRFAKMASSVNVAQYLFARLHEMGVGAMHGVPGDYNLVSLDYLEDSGIAWVGNCNELNAGSMIQTPHNHTDLNCS